MRPDALRRRVLELEAELAAERAKLDSFVALTGHSWVRITWTRAGVFTGMPELRSGSSWPGFSASQFSGARIEDFVHPDDVEAVRGRYEEAALRGHAEGDQRVRMPDGSYRWYHEVWRLLARHADGGLEYETVVWDIHERKLAELELAAAEQRLRLFFDHSPASLAMFDRDMRFLRVNPRFREEFGLVGHVLEGRVLDECIPDLPDEWRRAFRACLRGRVLSGMESPIRAYDGTVGWARWDAQPWRGPGGEIGGVVLFGELITDRRRAERERSELVSAMDAAGVGIAVYTREGRLRFANAAMHAQFERPSHGAIGGFVKDLALNESDRSSLASILAALRRGAAWNGRLRSRWLDGTSHVSHATISPVFGPRGHVQSVVAVVRDETRADEVEEALRQAHKLESLGALAGGFAHEFNNLLTGVLGNAGYVRERLEEGSEMREAVGEISASADRAAALTREMLAYAGRVRARPSVIDLSRVVDDALGLLASELPPQIRIARSLPPRLAPVEVDARQMRQVLRSLVENAWEALGERGEVRVSTGERECDEAFLAHAFVVDRLPAGPYVYLEVADDGVGMDVLTRARMFDPFFSSKFAGRGLALAAVLGIVRRHRAAIFVDSEPGKGTSVRVYLPAFPRARAANVLVVDFDVGQRWNACRSLLEAGQLATGVGDAAAALEALAKRGAELDVLVLAAPLPESDRLALVRAARDARPAVQILLACGPSEESLAPPHERVARPYVARELTFDVAVALSRSRA